MIKRSVIAIVACLLIVASYRIADAAVGQAAVPATCTAIAAGAFLNIQPPVGDEWIIHNIWFEYNVEIQMFDGTNTMAGPQKIGPDFQPGVWHVTNSFYLRVQNLHATDPKRICFDGIITVDT